MTFLVNLRAGALAAAIAGLRSARCCAGYGRAHLTGRGAR